MESDNSLENFEDAFARAESAVESLERGELPLEECIKRYEEGFQALKRCYALLAEAQKKVEILSQEVKESGGQDGGKGDEACDAGPEWKAASSFKPLRDALDRIDREQVSSSNDSQEHT